MQQSLLEWYQENKRPLIFREKKDAYSIWISEIMAQQTRIEAMLGYYERFIKQFPTLKDLAHAEDEELHKAWQGLGYYSRCRNLKKCAQQCMELYDGKLPSTKKELATLAGIGPYTAGAIASIAFNEKVSCVDGNVIRVFSRLYDIHEDVTKAKTKKQIEALVDASLVDEISDYNQALMELGALICIPQSPRCSICPIQKFCKAKHPELLPIKPEKKKRKIENKKIYIWIHDDKVHIHKRKDTGLLASMYEFGEVLPPTYDSKEFLMEYTHIFSHVEWHMEAYIVKTGWCDVSFVGFEELETTYAIPSAFMPFLNKIKEKI